jgi:hypothetical protein
LDTANHQNKVVYQFLLQLLRLPGSSLNVLDTTTNFHFIKIAQIRGLKAYFIVCRSTGSYRKNGNLAKLDEYPTAMVGETKQQKATLKKLGHTEMQLGFHRD